MFVLAVLIGTALAQTKPPTQTPATSSSFTTPMPELHGDYFRPYFFHDHPNLCGRVPALTVVNDKSRNPWDFYTNMNGKPGMIYLSEAQCGTCQSNAGIAGKLAQRWQNFQKHPRRQDQAVDMNIFVFNRNHPKSKAKFGMMKRAMGKRYGVKSYVSLHQDNDASHVWEDLGNFMMEKQGEHYNETVKFNSRKNDMYLIDEYGRVIRFLRDAILIRSRKQTEELNIHWRDVVHQVMVAAKDRKTVCDELQHEWLFCRIIDDWELNGRSFRQIRGGASLTIIVFIRADMKEFSTMGLLHDMIELSKEWSSPNYVVVVDSDPLSKTYFATVNLYTQQQKGKITLLLDEDNKVASQFFAAPGDLFATDILGRVIGFYNRVNLKNEDLVDQLKQLHLDSWNPLCDDFLEQAYTGTGSPVSTNTFSGTAHPFYTEPTHTTPQF